MNVQMMEGLVGASMNLKMSGVPMSVYRQASAEGDTEKMEQALGYTGECAEKAAKYQEKLSKGMKAEVKAEREKVKLEQEAAIEKRREEHKRTADGTEPTCRQGADIVQISEAAKTALKNRPIETGVSTDNDPAIYTATGEITSSVENESTVSFSA